MLRLLPRGLTNRQIGEALFVTERTAATHVQHLFAKLGVNSRTEAVAVAVEHRLVCPSVPTPSTASTGRTT